jgi:hypothetical protein
MGKWYTEEVCGDVYIYDEARPHAFGQPQGAPVFAMKGEDSLWDAQRACDAHNAEIAAMAAQPMICACGDQLDGRWSNGAWQCGICADIAELDVERGGRMRENRG